MPIYEYRCSEHGRFSVIQPMSDKHLADCPKCGEPAEPRMSVSSIRSAEPLTVLQDLGAKHGQHQGYKEIGWIPDSGISPPPGQPYKTAKEVDREEYGGLKEI